MPDQVSLVCSLTTLFASLSQRSPTNFECRSRSAIFLSPELPQMVIYVEIGMPHALGPRHLPKHPVRSELALGTTEALQIRCGTSPSRMRTARAEYHHVAGPFQEVS